MTYSLQNLYKFKNFKILTFTKFIEKLNLIGLEVDHISYEKLFSNLYLDNIELLLKIPANREDLLTEKFLLQEISTIFLIELCQLWEKVQFQYFFIIKQKYQQHINYSKLNIICDTKFILTYLIEIKNIEYNSSPLWLQKKLTQFGFQPTHTIADILNLVFFEWGQNINLLPEDPINNYSNFKVEYLIESDFYYDMKKNKILLNPGTIVLKRDNAIVSILGIINSLPFPLKKVDQQRQSCLLEATFYDIHTNSLLLNSINKNISLKYLRRAFLENFKYSLQRILTLFELLTSCVITPTICGTFSEKLSIKPIKILKLKKLSLINFLGIKLPDLNIFKNAGLKILCETKIEYYFQIPNSRHDLVREIDLIEEYSRFIGYKNFVEIFPKKTIVYNKNVFLKNNFIQLFFLNYGFHEIITNPLLDFDHKKQNSLFINNPLNNDFVQLRQSIIPKLLDVFEINSRSSYMRTNFFEIGRTFKIINKKIIEQNKISGIFQLLGNKSSSNKFSDWFIAKGFIESFLANFGYSNLIIEKNIKNTYYSHPTRSILFSFNNNILGFFGELNPLLKKEKYSHVHGTIYIFELNLSFLKQWQLAKKVNLFNEYSKFPLIIKDLSIILPKQTNFNELKSFIFLQSNFLKNILFFDIYFDEELLEKVTIGIRLEFQSNLQTLTNDFIENQVEQIKKVIEKEFQL